MSSSTAFVACKAAVSGVISLSDGRSYVVATGGWCSSNYKFVNLFDIVTRTWNPRSYPALPSDVRSPGAAVINGKFFIFGEGSTALELDEGSPSGWKSHALAVSVVAFKLVYFNF